MLRRKRIGAITAASLVAALFVCVSTALALLGDVNDDLVIDGQDSQQVLETLIGVRTLDPNQQANADVDGDGVITARDAMLIQQFSLGLISGFPQRLPQNSGPIAIARDGSVVGVVNPDSDSVTFLDTGGDTSIGEVAVGREPAGIAFTRDGKHALVTNSRDGTVSVLQMSDLSLANTIPVGVEPFGVVVNFRGDTAYVSNMASGTVSVIDVATEAVIGQPTVGFQPQGLAVTADSASVYVTHLKGGQVSVIDAGTLSVSSIPLSEIPFDEFNTLQPAGIPNRMKGIAIHPTLGRAWLPHLLSNSGNFVETLFNTSIFPAISVLDTAGQVEIPGEQMTLFSGLATTVSNPEAVAFSPDGSLAYVVSAASNDLTVIDFATGQEDPIGLIRDVGDHPRGIAVTPDGSKAYIFNRLTPDVTVVDLATMTILTSVAVSTDPLAPNLANGRRLFFTSALPEVAQDRFFGCEACHFDGRDDGQTWFFTNGPRQTLSMEGGTTADGNTGLLHHNADRENVQAFFATFTRLQNGTGLTEDQLNDLAAFVDTGIRALENPFLNPDGSRTAAARRGRRLFATTKQLVTDTECVVCHGGPFLTDTTGHIDPSAPLLHDVSTFVEGTGSQDEFDKTRDQPGIAGGTVRPAGHFEATFLMGVWATPPHLHDGRRANLTDLVIGDNNLITGQEVSDLVAFLNEAHITNARVQIDFPADAARVVTLTEVGGNVLSDVTSVDVYIDGGGPIAAVVADGRFTAVVPAPLVPAVTPGTLFDITAIATTADGEPGRDDIEVEANFAATADTGQSSVDATPTLIAVGGVATSNVTVTPRDGAGDPVGSGMVVEVQATKGGLGSVVDVGDGTYTTELSSSLTAETSVVTANQQGGATFTDDASVVFAAGDVDAGASDVTRQPTGDLDADQVSTATVTVVPNDAFGNPLGAAQTVSAITDLGSVGPFTDLGDGTYTATYTTASTPGTATITATVNAVQLTTEPQILLVADVNPPADADKDRISFAAPGGGVSAIAGGVGSVESLSSVVIENSETLATTTVTAAGDGSFTASLAVGSNEEICVRVDDIATNMSGDVCWIPFPETVLSVKGIVQQAASGGGFNPVSGALVELVDIDLTDICAAAFLGVGTLLTDTTAGDGSFEIVLPPGFAADLSLDPDSIALGVITEHGGTGSVVVIDAFNLVNDLGGIVIVDEFSTEIPFLWCDDRDLYDWCPQVGNPPPAPDATYFSGAENIAIESTLRDATTEIDFFGQVPSYEIEDDVFLDVDGTKTSQDQIAFDTYCAAAETPGDGTPPTIVEGRVLVPSASGDVPLAGATVDLATIGISGGLNATVIRSAVTDASGYYSIALTGTTPHGMIVVGDLTYDPSGNPGAFTGGGGSFPLGAMATDLYGTLVNPLLPPFETDLAGRSAMSLMTNAGCSIANFNAGEIEELTTLCRGKIDAASLTFAGKTLQQVFLDAFDVCTFDSEVQALLPAICDPEGNSCVVTVAPGPFEADGTTLVGITVQPVDSGLTPIGPGRLVELTATLGSITTPAIDNGDGIYGVALQAPIVAGTADVSIQFEGAACPQTPSDISVVFAADTTAPSNPDASRVIFVNVGGSTATVIGLPGTGEGGSQITVENTTAGESVTVSVSDDGSFRVDIPGGQGDSLLLRSTDAADNTSGDTAIPVGAGLALPGIANPSAIPGGVTETLTTLSEFELDAAIPAGYGFLAGFDLDLEGQDATAGLDVLIEGASPAVPGAQVLLVQVIEVLEQPELRVVAEADVVGGVFFPLLSPNFPGVIGEGQYAYIEADVAQAFVFGEVSGTTSAIEGARTTLDTAPFVDLTRSDGSYLLAGPVGSEAIVEAALFSHTSGQLAPSVLLPFASAEVPVDIAITTRTTRSFAFSERFGSVGEISDVMQLDPAGDRLYVLRTSVGQANILDTASLGTFSTFDDTQPMSDIAFTPNGFEAFIGFLNRVRDFTVDIEEPGLLISDVSFPRAVAVEPGGTLALIASSLDNSNADTDPDAVFVLDTFTNEVEVSSIVVDSDPEALVISADGTRAYVLSNTQDTLTVIDIPNRLVLDTVAVGSQPVDVAISPDGAEIYVANAAGGSVTVLDAALSEDAIPGNELLATVAVGAAPSSLALTPDGTDLLVADQGDDTVSVIDVATLTVIEVWVTVDLPADISIHPNGTTAYVLDRQTQKGVLELPLAASDGLAPRTVNARTQDRSGTLLQDSPIEVAFSEKMDVATLTGANLQVLDSLDAPIAGTWAVAGQGVAAIFTPDPGVRYELNSNAKLVLGTGLTDVAGNGLPVPEQWLVPTVVMQLPNVGLITLDLTAGGVVALGGPGAVEPDSDVTVTNTTTATDFLTQAASDGSFAFAGIGLDTDSYELVTSIFGGRAVTDSVPLVFVGIPIVIPSAGLVSYQPGVAGTLEVAGAAGAVDNRSSSIQIVNLTTAQVFETTTVNPDGSFTVGIFANPGDSLELVSTILGAIELDPVALASPGFVGPSLDFLTPDRFVFGDAVTLSIVGTDFGLVPINILLEVGGEVRTDFILDVVDGSPTQQVIQVDLPVGANSGKAQVTVAGQASSALEYFAEIAPNTSPFAEEVVSSFTVGDPNSALGQTDAAFVDLGEGGEIVLRLGSTVRDGPGVDLQVFEDTSDGSDCYGVEVSASSTGPFDSLGQFCGTAFMNLNGHNPIRFVRIVDAADGGPAAGIGGVFAIRVEISLAMSIDGVPVGSGGGGGVSGADLVIVTPPADKKTCVGGGAVNFSVVVDPPPAGGGGYSGGCKDNFAWTADGTPIGGNSSSVSWTPPVGVGKRYKIKVVVSRVDQGGCNDVKTKSAKAKLEVLKPEITASNVSGTRATSIGLSASTSGGESPYTYEWTSWTKGTSGAKKAGATTSAFMLETSDVTVSVEDSVGCRADKTITVSVTARSWDTPHTTAADDDPSWGAKPVTHRGSNRNADNNSGTPVINGRVSGSWTSEITTEQVSDSNGPFDDYYYNKSHTLNVSRKTVINRYLKGAVGAFDWPALQDFYKANPPSFGGPPPVPRAPIISAADLLEGVRRHENQGTGTTVLATKNGGHSSLFKKKQESNTIYNAAKVIEDNYRTTESSLVSDNDSEIGTAESGLISASTDPLTGNYNTWAVNDSGFDPVTNPTGGQQDFRDR